MASHAENLKRMGSAGARKDRPAEVPYLMRSLTACPSADAPNFANTPADRP